MRGEAGQRMARPSDEKFTDNSMFDIGKFQAFENLKDGESGDGGGWLGVKYLLTIA